MKPDRDDRDGGGSGGLAVLVVAGILVVMLLMLGAGAIYWVRQVMVLREETAARIYAEKLAWREAMERKKAEGLAAIVESATMRTEAAAVAAKGAAEPVADGEAVAEKESGKVEAGAGEEGKGEKSVKSGTRGP